MDKPEHSLLAYTLGVAMIVAINKMDDKTVSIRKPATRKSRANDPLLEDRRLQAKEDPFHPNLRLDGRQYVGQVQEHAMVQGRLLDRLNKVATKAPNRQATSSSIKMFTRSVVSVRFQ